MWYILCTEKILALFGYKKIQIKVEHTTVYKNKNDPPVPQLRVRKNKPRDFMDQYKFDL